MSLLLDALKRAEQEKLAKQGERPANDAAAPAATPISAGVIPSITTSRTTSAVPAPRAVLIPISRLRPRTMYDSTL